MIALDLQDLLVDAGFEVVGIAGKLASALAMIEAKSFDAAVVDANLAGVSSDPATTALTARGLPYVLLTGYSLKQKEALFPAAHFLQKPCKADQLIATLKGILAAP